MTNIPPFGYEYAHLSCFLTVCGFVLTPSLCCISTVLHTYYRDLALSLTNATYSCLSPGYTTFNVVLRNVWSLVPILMKNCPGSTLHVPLTVHTANCVELTWIDTIFDCPGLGFWNEPREVERATVNLLKGYLFEPHQLLIGGSN